MARLIPDRRDSEVERVIQILCRRRKNNPLLVGEAGVGKTAIAEGLALRIVKSKCRISYKMQWCIHSIWAHYWPERNIAVILSSVSKVC
jgi:DNA replication protein DnaC